MPHELLREDAIAVAAAARGEGNGTWSRHEAGLMLQRIPVAVEFQVTYWSVWAWLSATCATVSLAAICLVLVRPKLRAQPYNHFIVGLAIPDLAFSGLCAITCALHAAHGRWYDGEGLGSGTWMCDFQAFYCTFGVAGSLWVNVAVTAELEGLTTAMRRAQSRAAPTIAKVYARIGAALALALAISWVVVYGHRAIPSLPAMAFPLRELACLPVATDDAQQRFMNAFTLPILVWIPLALIALAAARVLRNLVGGSTPPPRPRPRWPWARRRADAPPSPAAAAAGARVDVDALVRDASQRVIVEFFGRLLLVIALMWAPFLIVCFLVVVPYHVAGGHANFFVGTWSHLQGFVSALIYFIKPDVRAELAQIRAELGAALGCGRGAREPRGRRAVHPTDGGAGAGVDDAADDAIPLVPADDWRPPERAGLLGEVHEPADPPPRAALLKAARQSASTARSTRRAATQSSTGSDGRPDEREAREARTLATLSGEALEQIFALEQTPMLVVEWAAFAACGRIPSSREGLARARADGDVVIFVSHRWWGEEARAPDDAADTKHALVCAGVRELIARHALAAEAVALWMDFACLAQEPDLKKGAQGVASLVAYAARASFVLIPVAPTAEALRALDRAAQPCELLDYGECAWCRLEAYAFLCLAHLAHERTAHVYAYAEVRAREGGGRATVAPSRAAAPPRERGGPSLARAGSPGGAAPRRPSDERATRRSPTGAHAVGRAACAPASVEPGRIVFVAARARALLGAAVRLLRERLAPRRRVLKLLQHPSQIRLARAQLPSAGALTVEADRAVIREVEALVRAHLARHAVAAERLRRETGRRGRRREFVLDFKQLDGPQLPLLASALHAEASAEISTLSLRGNLFGGEDVRELVRALASARSVLGLRELRLSANVHLGVEGVRALGEMLARPACTLCALLLDDCALSPECGHELGGALERNRSLRRLDVRGNQLDDGAVLTLLAARARMQTHGPYLRLSVEGNPIAPATHQLVALAHYDSGSPQRFDAARRFARGTRASSSSSLGEPSAGCLSGCAHAQDAVPQTRAAGGGGAADAPGGAELGDRSSSTTTPKVGGVAKPLAAAGPGEAGGVDDAWRLRRPRMAALLLKRISDATDEAHGR